MTKMITKTFDTPAGPQEVSLTEDEWELMTDQKIGDIIGVAPAIEPTKKPAVKKKRG